MPAGKPSAELDLQSYEAQARRLLVQGLLSRLGCGLGTDEIYNRVSTDWRCRGRHRVLADLTEDAIHASGSSFITIYSSCMPTCPPARVASGHHMLDSILQEIDIQDRPWRFEGTGTGPSLSGTPTRRPARSWD